MQPLPQNYQTTLNTSSNPNGMIAALHAGGVAVELNNRQGWLVSDVTKATPILDSYSGGAVELSYLQNQKILALEAQYEIIIAAGCNYSVTGGIDATQHNYQIDEVPPFSSTTGKPTRRDSQGTISSMGAWAGNVVNNVSGTATWPSNFAWRDTKNALVPMTAAQCYAFSQHVATYVAALFAQYCTLYAEITAAATASAVNAISITAGWPSN